MMMFMGGTPAGAPLLGWVADHFGARWTLIGGGALTALGTVVVVLVTTRGQGIVPTRYVRSSHRGGPDTGELSPVVSD
jgi:MFS family permease